MTPTESPEPLRLTATVDVDYSQFYLVNWGSFFDPTFADENSLGICDAAPPGAAKFTTFRRYGQTPVAVEVHRSEPTALGGQWHDVVEVPFTASGRVVLSGWDPGSSPTDVPVSGDLRIRYAISDGDLATHDAELPSLEGYLIQFWPAPRRPAAVIVQESVIGHHWRHSKDAQPAAAESADESAGLQP